LNKKYFKVKKIIILPLLLLFSFACKESPKEVETPAKEDSGEVLIETNQYPGVLWDIFEAHGGLKSWKEQKTLIYEIPKADAAETHTVDLYSRKDRISTPDFSMGYDGENVWLQDEKEAYKGDPVFYHNLMFYFYAMPFVLADDGINYGEAPALVFEGTRYPGISVSYDSGVGTSPEDEYFIHYDPETGRMAWLGYTVTYGSGEKSDDVSWIRYNDWMDVNGLQLPKSITWHNHEGRDIKEAKSTVEFKNISLSTTPKADAFYEMPEGGEVAEKSKGNK
jgi:hypothetical protein